MTFASGAYRPLLLALLLVACSGKRLGPSRAFAWVPVLPPLPLSARRGLLAAWNGLSPLHQQLRIVLRVLILARA